MNEGVVAILVVAGTIAGVFLGVRIQARKDARRTVIAPAGGRELWVPASLLALSVAFVGVVMWIAAGSTWRPVPGSGRGEDGALRVTVDLPGAGDTAAVQVLGEDLPDGVAVATAWVYVEDSDVARTAGLHARLVGRMRAGSSGSFSLVGERTALKPGAWTEVVWAGSYALELSPALGGDSAGEKTVRASRRLTSLGVRLEADRPYRGSVFLDDLRLYAAEAALPDDPR
jgi:hypothetical protein